MYVKAAMGSLLRIQPIANSEKKLASISHGNPTTCYSYLRFVTYLLPCLPTINMCSYTSESLQSFEKYYLFV